MLLFLSRVGTAASEPHLQPRVINKPRLETISQPCIKYAVELNGKIDLCFKDQLGNTRATCLDLHLPQCARDERLSNQSASEEKGVEGASLQCNLEYGDVLVKAVAVCVSRRGPFTHGWDRVIRSALRLVRRHHKCFYRECDLFHAVRLELRRPWLG